MAPLLSITTLLLFLFLFLSFSTPSLSEKTQLPNNKSSLPTKKILQAQEDEKEEGQPISKPKKNQLPTKKSRQEVDDGEEEEEQPISKPKKNPLPTKKSKQVVVEEEEQPISKTKKNPLLTKKPKQEEEEDQPISKPKKNQLPTKKPKELKEEQPVSKPKKTSPPAKQSKEVEVVKEGEEEQPKPKPKKIPSDNFKNQTKLLKPKKPKSNSTTATPTTQINTKTSKIQSPTVAAETAEKKMIKNPKLTDKPDPIWLDDPSEDEDIISEFRDLPTRIQSSLLPDLRKISITSRAYIYRANRELTSRVKPFVGGSFAPRVALAASCVFLLLLPLLLVALLFYHLNSYVSLQRFLLFVQAYLAVYFLTLSLSALATGLEPLRFFHATSPSAYAWMQAVQTLAYVLYLLVQVINLVVVFSGGETGPGARSLALTQVVVGLAVGMHYYAAVFHRAVAGEPPRANWKVHAVYAGCFLVVCAFARDAERRKKAYDGGEDGKKN